MVIDERLFPYETRYFDRDGVRMAYVEEGAGDPVVMVHGNPTWSFYYRRLIADLKEDYRVVAPDHVGCGRSDKPQDYPYTLERRVDDLEALLDSLQIRGNITLVLHDWGGMIGMAYASRHPDRIARLVLFNTAAFGLPPGKRLPFPLKLARTPLGAFLVRGLNLFCLGAARYCFTRAAVAPEVRAGYLAPYDSWDNRVAVLRFVQDIPVLPGAPGFEIVSEVDRKLGCFRNVPTLICWGMKDFVFDAEFLSVWRSRLPEAEFHTFADSGHYVLEDAHAEIRPLVRDFLKRHPLAGALTA